MKFLVGKPKRRLESVYRTLANLDKIEILVLGDSHTRVFSDPRIAIPGYWFRVVSVGGATISGLKNPNSVTQAQPIFEKAIQNYRGKVCITLLGEVDTGFVIWYRAKKNGVTVAETFEQTVLNYISFIEKIPRDKNVIVISAPLPTIQDGQDWGEIANARREVTASQLQRTELALKLNERMENYAKESGVLFISLDSESIGQDGLVKKQLLNTNSADHHYNKDEYISILDPKLKKVIKELGAVKFASRRA